MADPTQFNDNQLALIGALLLITVAVAWWFLRARLPARAVWLGTHGDALQLADEHVGGFALVSIGTYGANQLLRLLILLVTCGLERLVGGILVIENDTQQLEQFRKRLPAVFANRVVYGFAEGYSGGLSNRSVPAVLAEAAAWGPSVQRATRDFIALYERRNASRAPSTVLLFWSLGGQAALGLPAAPLLTERWPAVLRLAATALPIHERLRDNLAELKAIGQRDALDGWLVSDNLTRNANLLDSGMVALIQGLADSALAAERTPRPNNALRLALKDSNSVLIYQIVASQVVAYPTGWGFLRRFYVYRQPVIDQMHGVLRTVERGEGLWSVTGLAVDEPGTSTFDIATTALYHDDLREVEATIMQGRELEQTLLAKQAAAQEAKPVTNGAATNAVVHPPEAIRPNYEILFASVVAPIGDPHQATCPVVGIRLSCVRGFDGLIDELVKTPERRSAPVLPPALPQEEPAAEKTPAETPLATKEPAAEEAAPETSPVTTVTTELAAKGVA